MNDDMNLIQIIKEPLHRGSDLLSIEMLDDKYNFIIGPDFFKTREFELIDHIPISEVGIFSEIFTGTQRIMNSDKITYVADMDRLPDDIRQKLSSGFYSIGKSKQVDGNLRAVILDENGVRVKDITMKKVVESAESIDIIRSIGIQMQLRQIMNRLDEICELQEYLASRERDTTIYVPFLNLCDYIIRAQHAINNEEARANLVNASNEITNALNSLYTDYNTSAKALRGVINRPILQNSKNRNRFINYIVEDVMIAYKYVPISLAVLNYLNDYSASYQIAERYRVFIDDFFCKMIKGKTVAQLLQWYYPYNDKNINCWIDLAQKYEDYKTQKLPESVFVLSI